MKRLSILIPAYNVEKYIADCLDSILNQDVPKDEYEILIIDDGSKDSTLSILREYEKKYVQIRVRSQENKGVYATRNTLIKDALGEYIWFIDGDDLIIPGSLKIIFEYLNEKNDLIRFNILRIKEEELFKYHTLPEFVTDFSVETTTIDEHIAKNGLFAVGVVSYIVRKQHLKDTGLSFREDVVCEDSRFSPKLFLNTDKVVYIKTDVYTYVTRQNSITTGKSQLQKEKLMIGRLKAACNLNEALKNNNTISQQAKTNIYSWVDLLVRLTIAHHLGLGDFKKFRACIKYLKTEQLFPIPKRKGEVTGLWFQPMNWKVKLFNKMLSNYIFAHLLFFYYKLRIKA